MLICEKLLFLPGKQKMLAKVWKTAYKTCYYYPLGSSMCQFDWPVHAPWQRRNKNWLHVPYYDWPSFQLVLNRRTASSGTYPTSHRKIQAKPHDKTKEAHFDKSLSMISTLVNRTWFSRYPHCQQIIYDNGSEFKLHFETLCDSFGIKLKPPSVKKPQAMQYWSECIKS